MYPDVWKHIERNKIDSIHGEKVKWIEKERAREVEIDRDKGLF